MPYGLDHWKNPRNTIANVYHDNDMAYTTHGIKSAMNIIRLIDIRFSELADKTILEYGCGTSKNLRPLTYFFKSCTGYDPVKECIDVANEEIDYINKKVAGFNRKVDLIDINKITLTYKIIEIINQKFDYVFATDVFQHLSADDSSVAINNMLKMTNVGGSVIFNSIADIKCIPDKYKNLIKVGGYYIIKK